MVLVFCTLSHDALHLCEVLTKNIWNGFQLTVYGRNAYFQYLLCPKVGNAKRRLIRATITKTYLYNFDPLKPHFYIVKLRFTGVYIIFLISAQNIDCGHSLKPPRRGGSNEYSQSMFWAEIWKNIWIFYLKICQFLVVKFSIYLNRRVFVMGSCVLHILSWCFTFVRNLLKMSQTAFNLQSGHKCMVEMAMFNVKGQ